MFTNFLRTIASYSDLLSSKYLIEVAKFDSCDAELLSVSHGGIEEASKGLLYLKIGTPMP
jgi:hypothetical protein